ncbi:MAG: gliding motility protein GldM [Bacteroidales bacterium]|nr:gliding motility protein GldM [Bacteroidales bacterium]
MAGYKETPRQKMIGMMYLVLTAMLALNVSKQLMDAFLVVNESMETTNENLSKKLENTYSKFKIQYQLNPNKVGPFWAKAQQAHALSNNFSKYIDSLKYLVIMRTEKMSTMDEARKLILRNAKRKENFDVPTNVFIGSSQDGSAGASKVLKEKIELYKKQMLDLVDPKFRNSIKMGMDTKGPFYDADGNKQNWEMHNFYHTILAATVTILNNIKAEVYNAEFDVVNNLYGSIDALNFKFDKIQAKVIPRSSYIFLGEEYQAEILVGAYDTKQNPDVRYALGSDTLTPANFKNATSLEGSNGMVILKLGGSSEGLKKYAGIIKVVSPLGDTMTFHFKDEFIVAKPAITISPIKMNVFYIGVDNPVEISVPGGPERIVPSISTGSIRQDGKEWIVSGLTTNGAREAVISVNAVFSGKSKNMGSYKFRLKTVPDPIIKIAGKNEGFISKSLLLASPFLVPEMTPGFDFDLRYTVTSFVFSTATSAGEGSDIKVQGNRLTPEILKVVNNARRNQRIWFDDIYVKGPDGTRQVNTNLSLKLN